jgi:hypothetical protein
MQRILQYIGAFRLTSASSLCISGRRLLLLLCTLVSFSSSCENGTFNPWLSPAQVEVEGECSVFTGRIVADDWAGRPIKTKHGVRYRASTRPIRLPATVRLVVVETWQPGTCPEPPKLQEIPEKADQETHWPPAVTFTARQRGEEGLKTLVVREEESPDFSSLSPEKSFPWPYWPFTHYGRPNIRLHALGVELARRPASMFELQACVTEHCSTLEWPAKGHK